MAFLQALIRIFHTPPTQDRLAYREIGSQSSDRHQRVLGWTIAAVVSTLSATIFCIALGYWAVMTRSTPQQALIQTVQFDCGSTAAEAASLGCEFDILTNNWIPSACVDYVTAAEFRAWGSDNKRLHSPWPYYHDEEAAEQVDSEHDLSEMVGHDIFTTTENHIGHCVFLMRRLHRLAKGEVKKIAQVTFSHTMHCTNKILKTVGNPEYENRGDITSFFKVSIVTSCLETAS